MPKTSTARVRAFRERQRAQNLPKKIKKPVKTARERQRESRARRKLLQTTVNIPQAVPIITTSVNGEDGAEPPVLHGGHTNGSLPYSKFIAHRSAHQELKKKFLDNPFGAVCGICDRLWFKDDLKEIAPQHEQLLATEFPEAVFNNTMACKCCIQSLQRKHVPTFAKLNGFSYPIRPAHLSPLNLVSERLIAPRIPFMQIRRLRHIQGQSGIYGQIINVPVCVNTMVHHLPRDIDDDQCIYVHIKRKKIHKSSDVSGLINKHNIKTWLQYLIETPLYKVYNININPSFFENSPANEVLRDEISEDIPIEESLIAQQQTLQWNEEKYLRITPGEMKTPQSILFDEHAEELSFPSIYLGHYRVFKDGLRVTPFMITTSELRRSDRRGVTPQHLLYMAMKIMRLRVRDFLTIAFKHVGKDSTITKQQIESEEYINQCIDTNLAFLKCIPNSSWYWADRKKELFAMLRQLGKPTLFMTMSANESGWKNLLQTLYKLQYGINISQEMASQLSNMEKSILINEDSVTCAIYFNKILNSLMTLLQSKKCSPFGQYRVAHYFKRIEFQHRGSPRAHILLWLQNAPKYPLGEDKQAAITMIDSLISVSAKESSGNIELQTHKHTFECFERISANMPQKCRFQAPFLPCRSTVILTPMEKIQPGFVRYAEHYKQIRNNLENNEYMDMNDFYERNEILSDEHYLEILRASITRPSVFLKRQPSEKWHNPFNPFILNVLQANTDIQFITDESACATYLVEYVAKTDRSISNLQRQITQIQDEYPDFDIVQIAKKMSVDTLNTVEMTSQEAAWYLLREPISKSSSSIVYIPTVWPVERQRIKKTQEQLAKWIEDDDSTDIWRENWFDKYEKRPADLDTVSLAQFVMNYTRNINNELVKRRAPRIIRYRNYNIVTDLDEYRREMVTLHLPFRNEETDILSEAKFIQLYEQNEELILQRRKKFESNLNIQKIMEICRQLSRKDLQEGEGIRDATNRKVQHDAFRELYNNKSSEMSHDLRLAALNQLSAIAKRPENLTTSLAVNTTNVGDICAARRVLENGQTVINVVVYISPNQSIQNIIDFIHKSLIVYTPEGSAVFRKVYHKMPMILRGDFNINFATPAAQPLVKFLSDKFNLRMNNDPSLLTMEEGTIVDAAFVRYLDE